jgi:thiamine-monophosphate kinase
MSKFGERRIIEDRLIEIVERAANRSGRKSRPLKLGIGDDAALFLPKPSHETILTCDWFLEGIHFLLDKHPADAIGWKCLARALSDVAAMGGQPACFLLSLALPKKLIDRWLKGFIGGLTRAARKFHCPLAGGDMTRRADTLINVTVVGEIAAGQAALRSGASPGDVIFVSGRLGLAELGLQLLRSQRTTKSGNSKDSWLQKHLYPEPRLHLGQSLTEKHLVTAMMDLSDGLSSDLTRLCSASRVGARIATEKLPTAQIAGLKALLPKFDQLDIALHGGDDYELLFTVPRNKSRKIPKSFQGVPLTEVGEITSQRKLLLVDSNGKERPLIAEGWDPFSHVRKRSTKK